MGAYTCPHQDHHPHPPARPHLHSGRLLEACAALVGQAYERNAHLEQWEERWDGPIVHVPIGTAQQRFLVREAGDAMIVSLPGTTRLGDWAANLSVHYEPIQERHIAEARSFSGPDRLQRLAALPCAHSGFLHRARTVPVRTLLRRAEAAGKRRIIFTGHSLGGSVAKLSALLLMLYQEEEEQQRQQQQEGQRGAGTGAGLGGSSAARQQPSHSHHHHRHHHRHHHGNGDGGSGPHRVEILSLSFAAPVCCNEALVQLVHAKGWKRRFYNVIVPEDYCLKLFNGVLQSAANPEWLAAIQHALFSEGHAHSTRPNPPLPPPTLATSPASPAPAGPAREAPHGDLISEGADHLLTAPPVLGAPPVLKPFGGMPPLGVSPLGPDSGAAAGGSSSGSGSSADGSSSRCASSSDSGRVRFADSAPALVGVASAAGVASCGSGSGAPLVLDGAPSFLLRPADSLIQAYAGTGSSSDSNSGEESDPEAAGGDAQSAGRLHLGSMKSSKSFASFARLFMGERVTISRPSEDACSCCNSSTSSADGDGCCSRCGGARGGDTGAAAAGGGLIAGGQARVASWLAWPWAASQGGPEGQAVLPGWQQEGGPGSGWEAAEDLLGSCPPPPPPRAASFGFRGFTPRALTKQLTATAMAAAKAVRPRPGSWAAGALKVAARALGAGTTLLTAPLDVLEAWLVIALRPPPYRHVGHQLILTHQGLRPQVAPLQAYNRHRTDAYNNRELALVVFREHSIVFYKRRIAALVGQAVEKLEQATGAEGQGEGVAAAALAVN